MKCWGLWYGGSSYSCPTFEDMEEFDSLKLARMVFEARYNGWDFDSRMKTPAVDKTSTMSIFFTNPKNLTDFYPDKIIHFNDNGAIVVEDA